MLQSTEKISRSQSSFSTMTATLWAPSWFSSLLWSWCKYTKYDCLNNLSNFIPCNQFKRLGLKTTKLKPHSSLSTVFSLATHLSAHIHRNPNDHCRYGNASNQCNANRSAHKCAQLPQDFLLPAPGLLTPERASRRTVSGKEKLHRNVTLAQKEFWWLQLWPSSVLRSTVNNAVKFRCLTELCIVNTAVVFRTLTLSSAGQRSPSYTASRTHSHTQRRSCDYSSHRSSWWCRPHSGDMALCHRLRETHTERLKPTLVDIYEI